MTITRKEWARTYLFCFACGRSSFTGNSYDKDIGPWRFECHEIPRGVHRQRALKHPAAWLQLCQGLNGGCHEEMSGMPIAVQLALKKRADPEHYDREAVNRLRRRAPDAVTEAEVDEVLGWLEEGATVEECRARLEETSE